MNILLNLARLLVIPILIEWRNISLQTHAATIAYVETRLLEKLRCLPSHLRLAFMLLAVYITITFIIYRQTTLKNLTANELVLLFKMIKLSKLGAVRDLVKFLESFTILYFLDHEKLTGKLK